MSTVENEKQGNLANARRKMKQFRDQQQRQNGSDYFHNISKANGNDAHLVNGTTNEPIFHHQTRTQSEPQEFANFVDEQQTILQRLHENLSKSPITQLEEQNRQFALLLENQKQQRVRLEDQRQLGVTSSMSGRSSQVLFDNETTRQMEQKYRRDLDHVQEQLEIHVQTIGILVAEKSDLSAKLNQALKQLERKQSETEEIQGRLKASRERVEELERLTLNSTSHAQKREMEVKESDREIDRLKIENSRQSQTIEDLKQNLTELDNKFKQRQTIIDQLNGEITKMKQKLEQSEIRLQQYQSINDTSVTDLYEQRLNELQQIIQSKTNEVEALVSSLNQMRSDSEQMQLQYQQYNANVQRHVQELNEQIKQLKETNSRQENEYEAAKKSYEMKLITLQDDQTSDRNTIANDLLVERDTLREQNQMLQSAMSEWSAQLQQIRLENERLTTDLMEREQQLIRATKEMEQYRESSLDQEKLLQSVHEDKTALSRAIAQNKQLKEQLSELQDGFVKMSNDNMNLTTRLQTQEHLNRQLEERLTHPSNQIQPEPQNFSNHYSENPTNSDAEQVQKLAQRIKEITEENDALKEQLTQVQQEYQSKLQEHNPNNPEKQANESVSISSVASNESQNHLVQDGFVEKIIDRFNRAMRDNADLQDRTQQMEHLILQLQSETETIGDYITLYQQQRQQLHRRYQEKDEYIRQLTQDRLSLQRKLSELETLLLRGLNKPSNSIPTKDVKVDHETSSPPETKPSSQATVDESEWPEMVDNIQAPSSTEDSNKIYDDDDERTNSKSPLLSSLADFDDETRTRILTLLKELGDTDSLTKSDHPSTAKLAFVGKNLYVCSTCTGPVQWV